MLFKHLKGHKDSKGVSRSRCEPAGSQRLILMDSQSQDLEHGEGGRLKKKEKALLSQRNATSKSDEGWGNRVSRHWEQTVPFNSD